MSKSIYIVWCNDNILAKLEKYVNLSTKFHLLGMSENGCDAYDVIREEKPDILIISNEIRGIDGVGLVGHIQGIADYQPEILFYSAYPFVKRFVSAKNLHFHLKPVDAQDIYLEALEKAEKLCPLDMRIKQVLFKLKIPVKLKGYMYLRHAIELCHENPEVMFNLSKNLYPKICEKFDAICPLNVEKAIKNAVVAGCNHNELFSKTPSNKEILRYILDEIKNAE